MKKEDVREKIMHKYLENPNRSYNLIAKKLQINSYTVSCVIQAEFFSSRIYQTKICWWKKSFQDKKLVRKLVEGFKIQASHLGSALKVTFLIVLLQKFEINMVFILSNHKRCQTILKLKKKVQEPAAESCTTILFLKISVLLKMIKLTKSKIINKFLVLLIIFLSIEEKQIRNLNA